MVEIGEVLDAQILRLEPGDRIAIKSQRHLTVEQAEMLKRQLEAVWPGFPVVVLPPELDLVIVREGEDVD
jgi:hypothetical protein